MMSLRGLSEQAKKDRTNVHGQNKISAMSLKPLTRMKGSDSCTTSTTHPFLFFLLE